MLPVLSYKCCQSSKCCQNSKCCQSSKCCPASNVAQQTKCCQDTCCVRHVDNMHIQFFSLNSNKKESSKSNLNLHVSHVWN